MYRTGSGGRETIYPQTAWQQFTQSAALVFYFISLPFHTLVTRGPGLSSFCHFEKKTKTLWRGKYRNRGPENHGIHDAW